MDENNGNGSTNSTYQWFVFEDEFEGEIVPQTSSDNQIIIEWENTPEGEYTVLVQEINSEVSCEPEPKQMSIILRDLSPENILGPNYVCEGETIALAHTFQTEGEWALEDENIGQISQNGNFEALHSGQAIVNFSYNNNGCEFSVSKLIQVHPKPQPSLQGGEICLDLEADETIILNSGLSHQDYDFQWYHNEQLITNSSSHIFISEVGEFKLIVTNQETGCVSDVISTQVVELQKPAVSATVYSDFENNQRIEVSIDNPEAYLFKLGDAPFQESNIFYNITTEGKHHISIKEKDGCFFMKIEVIVINYPKFFTPNNDSYNDTWNIHSLRNDPTAEVYIFDRYGKLLKTISPAAKGWDGTYHGKKMPSNDYWFLVEYTDRNDGSQRSFRSNFTLKR
ncbi:T9SS type B sorting domain-containing protein [Psychroflexus aestuariivivens]|uniref:T9SS type B sorting domain-containing protein n=1 Tax=Psychroflexus aestuariivivens TaxID=1795040 RepID=UPI001865671D|nr:T9SS type B sorting domain-containing protein [Psychroflexus aestuariivivens]